MEGNQVWTLGVPQPLRCRGNIICVASESKTGKGKEYSLGATALRKPLQEELDLGMSWQGETFFGQGTTGGLLKVCLCTSVSTQTTLIFIHYSFSWAHPNGGVWRWGIRFVSVTWPPPHHPRLASLERRGFLIYPTNSCPFSWVPLVHSPGINQSSSQLTIWRLNSWTLV